MINQFDKLIRMLKRARIPFEQSVNQSVKVRQLGYPNLTDKVCSVIYGGFSYGGVEGFLEIMGLLTPKEKEYDMVVGWLTADDVFERIKNHWETNS